MSHKSQAGVAATYVYGGALVLACLCLSLMLDADTQGIHLVSPLELWHQLSAPGVERQVLLNFRLPRVLAALVIGVGLAGAGCTFQAALRNPLAEPYTLGISSGSALAAVLAIRLGADALLGGYGVGLAALAGAFLTMALVWRLGRVHHRLPAATLLLAGIAIAMFASAASLAVQYTADLSEVYRMVRWMMGGLAGVRGWPLAVASLGILAACALMLVNARTLNALSAGDDIAASVGVAPYRSTSLAFAMGSAVVGLSIALAGPIGFVGLIVPHMARALVGPDHRRMMPLAMAGGGALLVACDALARSVMHPAELPVGVITALLGGPFFLRLLLREKVRGQLWG